jgi:membrane-associated phospholipid phosphatase
MQRKGPPKKRSAAVRERAQCARVPLCLQEGSAARHSRTTAVAIAIAIAIFGLLLQPLPASAIDWDPERAASQDLFGWKSDRELLHSISDLPRADGIDGLRRNHFGLSAALAPELELPVWRQWLPFVVSLSTFALVELLTDSPKEARWSKVNSFDDSLRDDLRANSSSGRDTADTVSDIMLYGSIGLWAAERIYAGVQEAQHARQRDPQLGGWQAAGITGATFLEGIRTDMPWLLWAGVATRGTKSAAGRARPKTSDCLEINDGTDCGGRSGNQSFLSGHTSFAATMAGLTCTHRMNRLDRNAVDIGICAFGGAMAVTAGAMRVVGDEHWTTDVMAGSVVGALFGWVLPNYWPFGPHRSAEPSHLAPRLRLTPLVAPDRYGLGLRLRF